MLLTKTHFLQYLDSPLHLWAYTHQQLDHKPPSIQEQHIRDQGYQLEHRAKQFLQSKVTREYPPGSTIEFEVTFVDEHYQCRVDALVHDTVNNTFDVYEIKSSTKVKPEHKYDTTFQHLILKNQLPLHKVYLVHVNNQYIKHGDIDIDQLFVIKDMSECIEKLTEETQQLRQDAFNILKSPTPPTDKHCYKPKTCPCKQLCHPNLPEYSIYDLPHATQKTYAQLLEMGITDITHIPSTFPLNHRQRELQQSLLQQKPLIYNEKIARDFNTLKYPLYFLDYETYLPGIPLYDGYKPYQNITFQYSLHVINSPQDSEIRHYEFLATNTEDCSQALCDSMLSHISPEGTIVVWYKSFECSRNKELAGLRPECADRLLDLNSRIYDLKDIFSNSDYVDYRFHGSASIKDVLPILVPELSYANLEINKGDIATIKWYEMVHGNLSESEKQQIQHNLLEYCKLDTLAMVEIYKKLKQLIF